MMNKEQINKLKIILKTEIESTKKKIDTYTKLCQPIAPENAIGRVSRMDAINNKSVVEAALREAQNKMQQLLLMQNKTEDDDFGSCLNCKQPIPFGRLMIRPHSKYCVNCAQ